MSAELTFSERLHLRSREWWPSATQLWNPSVAADFMRRNLQRRRLMSRDDPIESWHRGRYWQRRLDNKWNSREFAAKHGLRIPELFWHGRNPGRIPLADLPSHYVIRDAWSGGSVGVYVVADGEDLLRGIPLTSRMVTKQLRSPKELWWPFPVLVEEFLRTTEGEYRLPVDYRFHCFNGQVAAITVHARRRAGRKSPEVNFYDENWQALPGTMRNRVLQPAHFERPASFEEMLEFARTMGRAYESYVRVDLYDTDQGCVFGEIASYPWIAKYFSGHADRLLGSYWSRYCNDQF